MNRDANELLREIIALLDDIQANVLPSFESRCEELRDHAVIFSSQWTLFSVYVRHNDHYTSANGRLYSSLPRLVEFRHDVEVALSERYLSSLLDLRNSRLIPRRTIDLGVVQVEIRPDSSDPGGATSLPLYHYPTQSCHGQMPSGIMPGEFGVRPGMLVQFNDDTSQIRLGVTFGLSVLRTGGRTFLHAQLARRHGLCPSNSLPEDLANISAFPLGQLLDRVFPIDVPLARLSSSMPPDLPAVELFGCTRNGSLLNLHFTYSALPRRARARIPRIRPSGAWDYAISIEITPIRDSIADEVTSYDYETAINDGIEPICGLDPIDVHITDERFVNWRYNPTARSYVFELHLDYDFVLTGSGVHGTMFGELSVSLRDDGSGRRVVAIVHSREKDDPTVHTDWWVLDAARSIAETISDNLYSRIGGEVGEREVFAPAGASAVRGRFENGFVRFEVTM